MIKIDGSTNEGGGQILRTAIALSAITKKPCHVFNIRAGRKPRSGLMTSHLNTIRALTRLSQVKLEGDFLNSEEIKFYPGEIKSQNLQIKIRTAGSITLVLHGLILPALFADRPIAISFNGGATDTFFSPTIDHFQFVFLEILEKAGAKININITKRGFYPQGNANLFVEIKPPQSHGLKPISLIKRGELKKVLIISGASENLKKRKVAERQVSGAKQILTKLKLPLEEKIEYYSTNSTGSQINIIAQMQNTVFGIDNLGKLGKSAEIVGQEAARDFLKEVKSGACLDKHTADQILPYIALASGKSQITASEITSHCCTNIWVIEKFIDSGKFEIKHNKISWLPI